MKIAVLKKKPNVTESKKLESAYSQMEHLLGALSQKKLPDEVIITINKNIEVVNATAATDKKLKSKISKTLSNIVNLLEKEVNIVPVNHYRNKWLVIGLSAFGLPIGIVLGSSLDNMGLLGIGLPIGMAIGIAVGTKMDQKALAEGRQLELELK